MCSTKISNNGKIYKRSTSRKWSLETYRQPWLKSSTWNPTLKIQNQMSQLIILQASTSKTYLKKVQSVGLNMFKFSVTTMDRQNIKSRSKNRQLLWAAVRMIVKSLPVKSGCKRSGNNGETRDLLITGQYWRVHCHYNISCNSSTQAKITTLRDAAWKNYHCFH